MGEPGEKFENGVREVEVENAKGKTANTIDH